MKTMKARQNGKLVLKLFVTGMSISSIKAIENLKVICKEDLKENEYTLEIIDIYKNPEAAWTNDIIACPTLLKEQPEPVKKIIGDLSDRSKVLKGLEYVRKQ